ncbi:hypothetical protein [Streptomyces albireticuli]|uniref:hypothetical protein n=1 Tax=Streptomyces albireticuli TaxID=1940 RepID=UPI0011801811|nr:hypothetical protein [Streptomyces albireticuli]MCD9141383.1 hypothetical protein [Streptomyces albireticuli]MCD9160656.1 hypothetical protein [Streptomyces albireticuli]MCD9195788.1 hypothetical protein [Streptomyces albireticuli]
MAIYDGSDALAPVLLSGETLPPTADTEHRPYVESVLVDAAHGRTAVLRQDIRRTLDNPALLVQDRTDARAAAVLGQEGVPLVIPWDRAAPSSSPPPRPASSRRSGRGTRQPGSPC